MRATTYTLALAALVVSLVTLAAANDAAQLEKRQAAAGGGAGVATTYTGVQIISGYTPPASTQLPAPQVSRGTILTSIPGFNMSTAANGAQTYYGNVNTNSTGTSSGAISLLTSAHFMNSATSLITYAGLGLIAAAAVLL